MVTILPLEKINLMKNSSVLCVIFMGVLMFSTLIVSAQGGPPPQGGSTSGPIDGGALGLLVGAAVYGYQRLRQSNLTEEEK
jgi:hypothetical protein